jgi:hypothetical protein
MYVRVVGGGRHGLSLSHAHALGVPASKAALSRANRSLLSFQKICSRVAAASCVSRHARACTHRATACQYSDTEGVLRHTHAHVVVCLCPSVSVSPLPPYMFVLCLWHEGGGAGHALADSLASGTSLRGRMCETGSGGPT